MARLDKTIQKSNTIRTKNDTLHSSSKLQVVFYRSSLGNEPVKVWLKSLSLEDRKTIGEEIKLVQLGWPIGMPLVRNLRGNIVLLHGFVKKQQETPKADLQLGVKRLKSLQKD